MSSRLSLRNRLLVASALTLLVFLGLVYYALEQSFVNSVTRTEAEKLQGTILLLLAEAEDDGESLEMPEVLQEARFNQLDSGLFGFVFDNNGEELWRSYSAIALEELPTEFQFRQSAVGEEFFGPLAIADAGFLSAAMGIAWEMNDESADDQLADSEPAMGQYTIAVLESADFFYGELEQFRTGLLARLFGVAAVLLFVQLLVLQLGLRPLQRLSDDVQRVEQGEISKLSGNYPQELQHLTNNLNQLLTHEQEQRERYRNRLSDLAHSLKTPLAIISGSITEKNKAPQTRTPSTQVLQDHGVISEQLQLMDDIVQYQLQRAHRGGPAIAQQSLTIAPVVQRITDALQKVYAAKSIKLELHLDDAAQCKMDEQDLMELLGNVLDNAFKYGRSKVLVRVFDGMGTAAGSAIAVTDGRARVSIADDGPGIPATEREHIFTRGQRLDTKRPGQGIGLAVVNDIVSSYQADILIAESELGGALFQIQLPR